jgi:hypothetical protein
MFRLQTSIFNANVYSRCTENKRKFRAIPKANKKKTKLYATKLTLPMGGFLFKPELSPFLDLKTLTQI